MNAILLAILLLQGTSSIEGTVVEAADQRPLAQTQIVAVAVGGLLKDSRITTTGADGKFSITGLAPGSYRMFFERTGFLRSEYGQRAAGKAGVPLEVTAGKSVSGITIPLTRAAAIYGRVINASNDPVLNATVKALKPHYQDGERSLEAVQAAQTNDLGEYRLFGLAPGSYVLSVTPISSPSIQAGSITTPSGGGFSIQPLQNILSAGNFINPRALDGLTEVTLYAPGTTDPAAASAIDLGPGSGYRMPDFVTIRARSYGIRGQIVDETGQPANATATLMRANSNESIRTNLMTRNSVLEFSGVLPGTYLISAAENGAASGRFGILTVAIGNENVDNLRLVLRPAIQVKGRILQEGAQTPASIRVQLRGAHGGNGLQLPAPAADGSFTIARLIPDDYRLSFVNVPANLYVRSARLGSADALNSTIRIEGAVADQLEIVLAPNTSSLDAVVFNRNRQPSAAATVVLIPDSARRQRFELYRTATTDASGRATLTGIAPGNYTLFAWQDIEPNAWQNADALRPFEDRGATVTIGENAKASATITVIE